MDYPHDLFEATPFIDGLRRARRGVVLVEGAGRRTTAWLITDDLVVVPNSFFEQDASKPVAFRCYHQTLGSQPIEAHLVERAVGHLAALLRISRPIQYGALPLATEQLCQGEAIIALLHHAERRELNFSIGGLVRFGDSQLEYTCGPVFDPVGSPLLNAQWAVVGFGTHEETWLRAAADVSRGVTVPAMLASLHHSPAWPEIVRFHGLLDESRLAATKATRPAIPQPAAVALWAALQWQFDPTQLKEAEQAWLRPRVVSASALQWSLTVEERQRALAGSSLRQLQAARGESRAGDHPGQAAIDLLLQGRPYLLTELAEPMLPYLLQAVRWFEGVLPDLPRPQQINQELERRRLRSRLLAIAGPSFRGRQAELRQLRDWYADETAGPLLLTGIGGVGKSALLAQFVTSQAPTLPLLWLDFDRPDLAPDNAVTVLTLLARQLRLQRPEVELASPDLEDWQPAARQFGQQLQAALQPGEQPLLVLDSFEVAQYLAGYNEIWQLLEAVGEVVPSLRVLVSGRAEVPWLALNQRPAQRLRLQALDPAEMRAWLREYHIGDTGLARQLERVTQRIPLLLRLVLPLLGREPGLVALPVDLPEQLVQGMLYQRILRRLGDQVLAPLVQHTLALRFVTEEILTALLADYLPPGLTPAEAFSRLGQELSVVSAEPPTNSHARSLPALHVRPDVRRAVLWLLAAHDPEGQQALHQRAAHWYGQQPGPRHPAHAAEAVYHSLLAGNLTEADRAWQPECARWLSEALLDLEPGADVSPAWQSAYRWLRSRLAQASPKKATLPSREAQLLVDVQRMVAKGDTALASRYLRSQADRRSDSPLVVFDAWLTSRRHPGQGQQLLRRLTTVATVADRDQALLGAYLAGQQNQPAEAYRLLALVAAAPRVWAAEPLADLARLAVRAAQLRLATDLPAELLLARQQADPPGRARWPAANLTAGDVLLPSIEWQLPATRDSRSLPLSTRFSRSWAGPAAPLGEKPATAEAAVRHLGRLGQWRRQAGEAWLLNEAAWQQLFAPEVQHLPLTMAVISTLTTFRGQPVDCTAWQRLFPSLDHLVAYGVRVMAANLPASQRPVRQAALALQILQGELIRVRVSPAELGWLERLRTMQAVDAALLRPADALLPNLRQLATDSPYTPELAALGWYLLGPEPLEMLCRLVLNLPDYLAL